MSGAYRGALGGGAVGVALALALAVLSLPLVGRAQRRPGRDSARTPDEEEALNRHTAGVALLRLTPPNALGALAELRRALELRHDGPLAYLEMVHIARCHQFLHQYADAVRWYLDYLRAAPPSARGRTADEPSGSDVKESIRSMQYTLAWLDIDVNVRAEVWDNNRPVGYAPGVVAVETGRRSVELRAVDHLPERRDVTVHARDHLPLRFVLQRVLTGGVHPAGALSTGAVAVVAMLGGAGFWIGALAEQGAVESDNHGRASVEQLVDARTYAVVGDVLMGTGLAFGVVAGILWARTDWSRLTARRAPTAMALPLPGGGGGGLQLVGSF